MLLLYAVVQVLYLIPPDCRQQQQVMETTETELSDTSDDSTLKTEYSLQQKTTAAHAARYAARVFELYLCISEDPVLPRHTPPPRVV